MASDDESTQPIDIAALRGSLTSLGAKENGAPLDEAFVTDEHTAVGMSGPREEILDSDGPYPVAQPASSITRINVGAPPRTPRTLPRAPLLAPLSVPFSSAPTTAPLTSPPLTLEEEAAVTLSPATTSRVDVVPSMPGTLPAHELVDALVAAMGARSERGDRLGQTDETDAGAATLLSTSPLDAIEEAESGEAQTATRLPFPAAWSDGESTSVSVARSIAAADLPVDDEAGTLASITKPRSESVASTHRMPVRDLDQPASEDDDTRMGRLAPADVRAVFAAAEHAEPTRVFQSSPDLARVHELDEEDLAEELDDADLEPEEVIDSEILDDDEDGNFDKTGEGVAFGHHEHEPEPVPSAPVLVMTPRVVHIPTPEEMPDGPDEAELPRYSLASVDDIVISASADDVQIISRPDDLQIISRPVSSISFPPGFDHEPVEDLSDEVDAIDDDAPRADEEDEEEVSYEDEGGATLAQIADRPSRTPGNAPDKLPLVARPTAPPAPPFQPPAPVGRAVVPAYEVDTDDDEDHLQQAGSFRALIDLYRLRAADGPMPMAKATLLHKIASVHEYRLNEPEKAFDLLVEAFDLRPGDDDIVASLDRVAREAGRVGELADRARKNLHTADVDLKVILLGHLVYWYERVLGRGAEISPFVSELERLDKTHPVILRRGAQQAAANGDLKSQRELLVRALDRTARRDEKVLLHLALASANAGTPEAVRQYEMAVANDYGSVVALQGYERVGREQGKHGQVEWCLERQVDVALTSAERIDALMKLADLHETKFLKRERAAEILERIVEIEPAHPQALKALERCYHALRDWPRLARVLRARADNTYDKKQKTELLELAAEVFESKLNDPEAAVEVHRDLLLVDPKHRRALGDLARLYEKLGDWGNMATYKARVAELAPTKRQASQQLVLLGDFLAAPDRDALAARMQYEKAVTVDPTNAAAWEALQRIAAAAGDDRRVAQCLEQRGKTVDGPRQRAAIYVELANLYATTGDERAARDSFENAVAADPTNESAAIAMLDVFTREERWSEAAPLCELLVNAATRDQDSRTLFTRQRLMTRIGAALGDADKAMTSSLAALDIQPDDEGAQADLVAVCTQCRDQPRVVMRAKEQLTRIASGPRSQVLPATVLLGLAQLQRDAGENEAAAGTLAHAMQGDPDHPGIQKELAEVYLALEDYPACCKLMVEMARNATSADARFQVLCDAGEIWAKRAGDLDEAAVVFEEARAIKPLDHWLLHTLMWVYGERQRWDALSNVLEGIAQIQESPDRKAKSFFAMAQVVLEKMADHRRAAELFDQVLDIDRTRLDAFEHLVRALTEVKDWDTLDLFYRKMIARVKDDPNSTQLQFVLFKQLGLIYRDRLEDAARAYEALEYAARLRPDEPEVRKIVTEILVVTDNIDNAVARTPKLITARGVTRFLEVGPDGVLTALTAAVAPDALAVAALRRDRDEVTTLLTAAASLFTRGTELSWPAVVDGAGSPPADLPTYAFQRQRYWPRPGAGAGTDPAGLGLGPAVHPLLGGAITLATGDGAVLTGRLTPRAQPWLTDHTILGGVLVPGTALLDLAVAAGAVVGATTVEELVLRQPLPLDAAGVTVQVGVGAPDRTGRRPVTVPLPPRRTRRGRLDAARHRVRRRGHRRTGRHVRLAAGRRHPAAHRRPVRAAGHHRIPVRSGVPRSARGLAARRRPLRRGRAARRPGRVRGAPGAARRGPARPQRRPGRRRRDPAAVRVHRRHRARRRCRPVAGPAAPHRRHRPGRRGRRRRRTGGHRRGPGLPPGHRGRARRGGPLALRRRLDPAGPDRRGGPGRHVARRPAARPGGSAACRRDRARPGPGPRRRAADPGAGLAGPRRRRAAGGAHLRRGRRPGHRPGRRRPVGADPLGAVRAPGPVPPARRPRERLLPGAAGPGPRRRHPGAPAGPAPPAGKNPTSVRARSWSPARPARSAVWWRGTWPRRTAYGICSCCPDRVRPWTSPAPGRWPVICPMRTRWRPCCATNR